MSGLKTNIKIKTFFYAEMIIISCVVAFLVISSVFYLTRSIKRSNELSSKMKIILLYTFSFIIA